MEALRLRDFIDKLWVTDRARLMWRYMKRLVPPEGLYAWHPVWLLKFLEHVTIRRDSFLSSLFPKMNIGSGKDGAAAVEVRKRFPWTLACNVPIDARSGARIASSSTGLFRKPTSYSRSIIKAAAKFSNTPRYPIQRTMPG